MHGGIAFRDAVIDLTDGQQYPIREIEIKEELAWKDIEEAAVGDEMSYYAS